MEKIILKSKVFASLKGHILDTPYRMVLKHDGNDWLIGPEQSFSGEFNEYSGLPFWQIDTVIDAPDVLCIDYREKWLIHGIKEATKEALKIIAKKDLT